MRRLNIAGLAAGFRRADGGVMAPIFALSLVILVGMAGAAMDVGRVMWVKRQLQSSADAAVLAGALSVASNSSAATTAANDYSGLSGKKNTVLGATSVTMVGGAPQLKCFSSVKVPACTPGSGKYNGIVVTQEARVPMYFLRVVGVTEMTPRATATASARGGSGRSLDVMVVLDATASMNNLDPNCSIAGASKMECAKAGVRALLQGLNANLDRVGFMVFPGLTKNGVTSKTTCNKTLDSSDVASYKQVAGDATGTSYTYTVMPLTSPTYQNGALDGTSVMMIAAGGGTGNKCTGIQSQGGAGTYFADAIDAARMALKQGGRPTSQKVIVVLGDGDATTPASKLPDSALEWQEPNKKGQSGQWVPSNLCQRAIARARAAAADGMWVYSVAYAASTTSGCEYDTSNYIEAGGANVSLQGLSACTTMKNIASQTTKFFSDGVGSSGCKGTGGTNKDLVSLFQSISEDLTLPRLLPNNTT